MLNENQQYSDLKRQRVERVSALLLPFAASNCNSDEWSARVPHTQKETNTAAICTMDRVLYCSVRHGRSDVFAGGQGVAVVRRGMYDGT